MSQNSLTQQQSYLVHIIVVFQSQNPFTDGLAGQGHTPHRIRVEVHVLGVLAQLVEGLQEKLPVLVLAIHFLR